MDKLMVTMSGYRKIKKPLKDKSEEEFVLEICNVFSACCIEAAGKQQFLEFEGIELMLIMLRNRQFFRLGCIKVSFYLHRSSSSVSHGDALVLIVTSLYNSGAGACNNGVSKNSRSLCRIQGYAWAACNFRHIHGQEQDCGCQIKYRRCTAAVGGNRVHHRKSHALHQAVCSIEKAFLNMAHSPLSSRVTLASFVLLIVCRLCKLITH